MHTVLLESENCMIKNLSSLDKLDIVNRVINKNVSYKEIASLSGISERTIENWVYNIKTNRKLVFRENLLSNLHVFDIQIKKVGLSESLC